MDLSREPGNGSASPRGRLPMGGHEAYLLIAVSP